MKNNISRYRVISKAEIAAYEKNTENQEIASEQKPTEDSYIEKVKKYIPAEIVGGYFFLHKLIEDDSVSGDTTGISTPTLYLVILLLFLILTPLYKFFQLNSDNLNPPMRQVMISVAAFLAWSFYLGGWFKEFLDTSYNGTLSLIIIVTFTLSTPLIENIVNYSKTK